MFDIAANLTHEQFNKDRTHVIERARQAGVNGLMILGTDLAESNKAHILAKEYHDYCYATVGIHPHHADGWNSQVAEAVYTLGQKTGVVAVGECGLDFNRHFVAPEIQQHAFVEQLAIAAELQQPLILHCRDAHDTFIRLLSPWLNQLPSVVVHCFTGTELELKQNLALGLSIGITGWVCDERRGLALRTLLPTIPREKLLLETDAPFLVPRDMQQRCARNEPAFLAHIVQQVALWRKEDPIELGQQTELNARRLFNLML